MPRVSRRRFTLAASAALATPALLPSESLGADVKIDFVHLWSGADHPVQKVIAGFNAKNSGVTVVSRQDGVSRVLRETSVRGGVKPNVHDQKLGHWHAVTTALPVPVEPEDVAVVAAPAVVWRLSSQAPRGSTSETWPSFLCRTCRIKPKWATCRSANTSPSV